MLNNPTARVSVVGRIEESRLKVFDYTGAFDVSEVIAERLTGTQADAVTNLVVTVKSNLGSFFINLLTLGLGNARVFQVEGDLVKMGSGLSESGIVLMSGPSLSDVLSLAATVEGGDMVLTKREGEWVLLQLR